MGTPPEAALWFLPFVLPIAIWVALEDMRSMKIPNKAVLALVAVFLVVGPFVLPLADWGLRWAHLAVVLAAGFVLNLVRVLGAGDAKFLAAMAPFVALGDSFTFFFVLAAALPSALIVHRLARATPAVRQITGEWESWVRPRVFPMGLPLAGTLVIYLGLAATSGQAG
ncbi:MAG: prepilin peptidase [Paracoccaceae bacterium]|nr:prepilin peptidase [Paracoccaceae bacterium]